MSRTTSSAAARVVRDYLRLGLRLGRHVDGFVDCWFGDPHLAAQVAAEPVRAPADLVRDARDLAGRLDDAGLAPRRRRFLAAQLTALECGAERLAGTTVTLRTEIGRCFGVDVYPGDPDRYAAVHDAISDLLGGRGPLRARVEACYERNAIGAERLLRCVQAVSAGLRSIVVPRFGLPPDDRVEYRVVHEAPWNAFNRYLGGFRSEVAINARAGRNLAALPVLVTHESYAGHHTEHCLKEVGLVRARRQDEQAIALVNTPQSLMAEGAAELSLDVVLGSGWGAWTSAVLADEGVHTEGDLVEELLTLVRELFGVRQDAMLMVHDRGVPVEDVVAHVQRWLLMPRDRAEQVVAFVSDPLWRAYTVTYVEGAARVGSCLRTRPSGGSPDDRFAALLREPLLPDDLRARTPA